MPKIMLAQSTKAYRKVSAKRADSRDRRKSSLKTEIRAFFNYFFLECTLKDTLAQHSYVPLLSLRRNSPSKSSPTFSIRPRSAVGRVTVDLICRSWVRFPPRSKYVFFTSCGSLIPFTRADTQWVIHGFN